MNASIYLIGRLQKVGLILVAALCVVIFLKYTAVNYTTTITTNDYSNLPRQFYKKNLLTDLPKDLNHTDSPHHTNITLSHPPSQLNASNNINSTDTTTVTTDGSQVTKYTSFSQTFHDFPWDGFEIAVTKNLSLEIISYSEALIDKLTYFLTLEPLVPVNEQCLPPPLPSVDEIDCTLYPKAFTGVKRTEPIKIGVLIQFGFDVDVLEIHMNELYDVVDKFFIIESTHAHYGKLEKPLIWEQVKGQKRFRKFPVVHFIIDDAEATEATDKQWAMESLQERRRWEKFSEWNAATKYFSDDDVIGKPILVPMILKEMKHLFLSYQDLETLTKYQIAVGFTCSNFALYKKGLSILGYGSHSATSVKHFGVTILCQVTPSLWVIQLSIRLVRLRNLYRER